MKKLVSIVMAIALGVSLAGCGGRASAESVVEDAIQAFQNADAEAIEQYWGDTDFSSSNGTAEEDAYTQQLLEQLAENLSYQITESTENENAGTATVTVEFTNIDMSAVLAEWMGEIFSQALESVLKPNTCVQNANVVN